MRKSLITMALAIGLLAGSASAASATTTATAPKLPVLYGLGGASFAAWNLPQVRPGSFAIFADGSAALVGAKGAREDKPIHWKYWTQRSAFADGYYTWRVNAAPGPYYFSAATISLWDVQTHGGVRPGVRYYDKMTIDFTQCHCNSHVVLKYGTVGSGKYIAGAWLPISGSFPGGLSAARPSAYVTTSVVTSSASSAPGAPGASGASGASADRKTPVAPELADKDGHYRIVWGVRPAGRFTIYSGPGVYLLGTRWASWTAATARATGELWGVDAKVVDLGHVSIVLSAPKSRDGLVYYSALRIVGGQAVVHYWRWYWSGPDIGWTPVG